MTEKNNRYRLSATIEFQRHILHIKERVTIGRNPAEALDEAIRSIKFIMDTIGPIEHVESKIELIPEEYSGESEKWGFAKRKLDG